jgi:hypothetical protein
MVVVSARSILESQLLCCRLREKFEEGAWAHNFGALAAAYQDRDGDRVQSNVQQVGLQTSSKPISVRAEQNLYNPPTLQATGRKGPSISSSTMVHGIDLTDRNAWDDSLLVNSWNDVVKEYEVSILDVHN